MRRQNNFSCCSWSAFASQLTACSEACVGLLWKLCSLGLVATGAADPEAPAAAPWNSCAIIFSLLMKRYAVFVELNSPAWHWFDCLYTRRLWWAVHVCWEVALYSWYCGVVGILAAVNCPQRSSTLAKLTRTQLEFIGVKFDMASSDSGMLSCVSLLAWTTLQLCGACCLHPIAIASRCLS